MAKHTGIFRNTRGKIFPGLHARETETGTILAQNPRQPSKARRSEAQADRRCQMGNMGGFYRLFDRRITNAFEGKGPGQNDYNLFIQCNYTKHPVYLTKQDSKCGGCVLAPYQISRGSLEPIRMNLSQSNVLSTNLSTGAVVINANTTVAELTMALLQNKGFQVGDQITFFYGEQYVDSEDVPRATMDASRLVLSLTDTTKVWDEVDALGFSTVNGCLGMSTALSNAGATYIHSRDLDGGLTQVSTQRMTVVSDILADYQSEEAFIASANSYGGINTREVYLSPTSTLADLGIAANENQNGGTQQSSGGSGSGTQSGGGTGSGTQSGGNTGGNSGSSLSQPTISGSTPFAESTTVTITGPAGAELHYTNDGTTPTSASTLYSEPITLTDTATIKAVAVLNGETSTVASRTFTKSSGGGGSENPETE